jgi:hypothetical protein
VRGVAGYWASSGSTRSAVSTTCDGGHYRATETSESFGVSGCGYRPKAAKAKFDDRPRSPPPDRSLADRAVSAEEPNIVGIGFLDHRGLVVLLTCGKGQCPTVADATKLAQQIQARLPKSW